MSGQTESEEQWCAQKGYRRHGVAVQAPPKEVIEAYANGVHLTLTPVELCVLAALCDLPGGEKPPDAYARVGIPNSLGKRIFQKLRKLHLIAVCRHGFEVPDCACRLLPTLSRLGPDSAPRQRSEPAAVSDSIAPVLTDEDKELLRGMKIGL